MSSPDAGAGRWIEELRAQGPELLRVARRSLEHGVLHGRPLRVVPEDFAPALRTPAASFVTLHQDGALRGCVGSLEVQHPLVVDVAERAFAAGLRDPRFPPVRAAELPGLRLQVSVLSPLERLEVGSEQELLARLRPGVDGLVLAEGARRGTFLPAVWESLPEPRSFLRELRRKAGLPTDHWSPQLVVHRYTVASIS